MTSYSFTASTRNNAYAGDQVTAYFEQFNKTINHEAQQMVELISMFAKRIPMVGQMMYDDYILSEDEWLIDAAAYPTLSPGTAAAGTAGPIARSGRFQFNTMKYPLFKRRRANTLEWYEAVPLERLDPMRMVDPQGSIMTEILGSFKRNNDKMLYSALGDSVSEGTENGGTYTYTDVALPTSQILDGSENSTFSHTTLKGITKILDYNEEGMDGELPVILLDEHGWSQIFADEKFISGDYNPAKPLNSYTIREFMGYRFVKMSSKRMTVNGDVVTSYAWKPSAMRYAVEDELTVYIDRLPELNQVTQIWAGTSFNFFRFRDTGVVKFYYLQD